MTLSTLSWWRQSFILPPFFLMPASALLSVLSSSHLLPRSIPVCFPLKHNNTHRQQLAEIKAVCACFSVLALAGVFVPSSVSLCVCLRVREQSDSEVRAEGDEAVLPLVGVRYFVDNKYM